MRRTFHLARLCLLAACIMLGSPACYETGGLMRMYGYTELLPPSTLLAPGALVTITSHPGEPLKTKILCGPRAGLGQKWRPRISQTITRTLERLQGQTFDLSSGIMDRLHASAKFKHIRKITATLDNPQLVELNDDDVLKNLKYRSPSCKAAIRLRRARGYPVTLISSALMGDARFKVEFDSNVEMTTPELRSTMADLAIELGAGSSSVSTDTIAAKGLVWGVRDDAFLASLTEADLESDEMDDRPARHDAQLLAAGNGSHLDQSPDAPLVRPPPEMTPSAPYLDDGHEITWAQPSLLPASENEASSPGLEIEAGAEAPEAD